MMIQSRMRFIVLIVLLSTQSFQTAFSIDFPIEEATEIQKMSGDEVTIDRTKDEMSYRIQYTGDRSIFVPLLEIDTGNVDNCQLKYSARMRTEEGTQKAYLEMQCTIDEKSYFSKALDDAFSGETRWREISTPFFLKKGEKAQKAELGVHFEGNGVVFLEKLAIRQYDNTLAGKIQMNWQWIPGTVFGVLAGMYGGFVGLTAQKGQAKSLVYGLWLFFVCISVLMLIAGIVLWIMGQPFANGYALMLPGVIGVAVLSPTIVTLNRAYEMAEARKMHARDLV